MSAAVEGAGVPGRGRTSVAKLAAEPTSSASGKLAGNPKLSSSTKNRPNSKHHASSDSPSSRASRRGEWTSASERAKFGRELRRSAAKAGRQTAGDEAGDGGDRRGAPGGQRQHHRAGQKAATAPSTPTDAAGTPGGAARQRQRDEQQHRQRQPVQDALDHQAGDRRAVRDAAPAREQVRARHLAHAQRQQVVDGEADHQRAEQGRRLDTLCSGSSRPQRTLRSQHADEIQRDGQGISSASRRAPARRSRAGRPRPHAAERPANSSPALIANGIRKRERAGWSRAPARPARDAGRAAKAARGRKRPGPSPVTSAYWTACETTTSASAACGLAPTTPRAAVPKNSCVPT